MRIFIYILIFSILLSSCQAKTNNTIVDKPKIKNKTDYSDTLYGASNKKEKDSGYFHTWTDVLNKKIDNSKLFSTSQALELIKFDSNKIEIIAKIKNLKFKIIPYKKDDNEKVIEYIAAVIKCYKGICPEEIHYRISYEIDDTIYFKDNFPAIVLLSKYDNSFYLNDQFVYFPATKELEIELEKIMPYFLKTKNPPTLFPKGLVNFKS